MARADADIEAAQCSDEYLLGYADAAHFISTEYSLSIYRKFSVLGARNLLYMQSELQALELQLQALDAEDQERLQSGSVEEKLPIEVAARSFEDLKEQAETGNLESRQAEKFKIIQGIRRLMKEYEQSLLRRNHINSLEKPSIIPFRAFKAYFRQTPPVLWGSGFHILDKEDDMIALGCESESDRISALAHRFLGYRLRKQRRTPKSWGPMYYYPVERVNLVVGIISAIFAAALLVSAIIVLYFIKPMGARLGVVGAFTVVFATSILLLTNSRRVEVYGATAAYAAVLVVFVSVNG